MAITVYIRNLSHITPKIKIDALLSQDKIRLHNLHTEGWEAIVQDNLLKEAMSFKDLIDDTVDRALIKDNVTGKVTWLKK